MTVISQSILIWYAALTELCEYHLDLVPLKRVKGETSSIHCR